MSGFVQWFANTHPAFQALVRVLLMVLPVLLLVPLLIWWERRLLSFMQDRLGPNRTGNITWSRKSKWVPGFLKGKKWHLQGIAQTIADGIKLFTKEDITPSAIDRLLYFLAPGVALFPPFVLCGVMAWGPQFGAYKLFTPVADVNIGILFFLAASSLGVYGVVLGGYSANNKYSLMGGLRASAQLISYELAMGMSLAGIVLATGSLKMTDMVSVQQGSLWGVLPFVQNWNAFTPFGFVSMIVFLIAMTAETNRTPFDLPEAENELIAGYHTEYSSMKFAAYYMGEYVALFSFSCIFVAIFLGGFNFLPFRFDWLAANGGGLSDVWAHLDGLNYWLAPLWFLGKALTVFSFFIWMRVTLPRMRYDQLMSLGWKTLLPVATANFVVVALWILATKMYQTPGGGLVGIGAGWLATIIAAIVISVIWRAINLQDRTGLLHRTAELAQPDGTRTIEIVDPSAGVTPIA